MFIIAVQTKVDKIGRAAAAAMLKKTSEAFGWITPVSWHFFWLPAIRFLPGKSFSIKGGNFGAEPMEGFEIKAKKESRACCYEKSFNWGRFVRHERFYLSWISLEKRLHLIKNKHMMLLFRFVAPVLIWYSRDWFLTDGTYFLWHLNHFQFRTCFSLKIWKFSNLILSFT